MTTTIILKALFAGFILSVLFFLTYLITKDNDEK